MRPTMAPPSARWRATLILWVMWSSHPMGSLLCQELGTRPSACGTLAGEWWRYGVTCWNSVICCSSQYEESYNLYLPHLRLVMNLFVSCNTWSPTMLCLLFFLSGQTTRIFSGHTKDVLSVAFSADNRQIVSGSRDKTIKLWNTLGVCKYTIQVTCFQMGNVRVYWVSCFWHKI